MPAPTAEDSRRHGSSSAEALDTNGRSMRTDVPLVVATTPSCTRAQPAVEGRSTSHPMPSGRQPPERPFAHTWPTSTNEAPRQPDEVGRRGLGCVGGSRRWVTVSEDSVLWPFGGGGWLHRAVRLTGACHDATAHRVRCRC